MRLPHIKYVYVISTIGQILSFVCGTCLTWSSPMLVKLSDNNDNPLGEVIPTSSSQSSWIGSSLTVGAIFGSFCFGLAAGKFGRKPVLIFLGFPFVLSFLMLAFCTKIGYFYFARTLAGFALGGVFTVVPMYTGEIAEDSNRGTLGAIINCLLTLGLLISVSLGPYLSFMSFNVVLAVFPAIFIVLFALLCPESPHYLIDKDFSKAEKSLKLIRGSQDVSTELKSIKSTVEKSQGGSFMDLFKENGLRKAFLIGGGLIFFQKFSGIDIVLFFGQTVFEDVGIGISSEIGPIVIAAVQFATSFFTPIATDRSGRRILLLISHISMLIFEFFFGLYYFLEKNGTDVSNLGWLPITSLILYIIGFNIGSSPIPWAIVGELFPPNVKNLASAGVSAICWSSAFLITQEFESVKSAIGIGQTFWIFSIFGLAATLFVMFFVIETKGKSLQQIQDELKT